MPKHSVSVQGVNGDNVEEFAGMLQDMTNGTVSHDEYGNIHVEENEYYHDAPSEADVKKAIRITNNLMVDEMCRWIRVYVAEACKEADCSIPRSEFIDALEVIMDIQIDKKLANRAIRKAVTLGTLVQLDKNSFALSEARKRIIRLAERAKNPQTR